MIISIDFDGTICSGPYPKIGNPRPLCVKYIRRLKADGHYIIINTCRCEAPLLDAINWLLEKEIPFDRINDNHPQLIADYQNNSRKIYAHIYIDDKQVGGLPSWADIYEFITEKQRQYDENHS